VIDHAAAHQLDVFHRLGKAAGRFARCRVQVLQRGFLRAALSKLTAPRRLITRSVPWVRLITRVMAAASISVMT
jgi:hypothetical protein